MTAARDQHIDAETLAEFIDRVLPPDRHHDVQHHLAQCAQCRSMLVGAVAFLDSDRPAGAASPPPVATRQRWPLRAAVGVAAAAALVLAAWFGFRDVERSDRPGLQALVTAFSAEPTRISEGRLTGGFRYAPPPPINRAAPDNTSGTASAGRSPQVHIAVAGIERAAIEQATPERQAALSVAQLADGNFSAAIAGLEQATRDQPMTAGFWSDLSAAYLAAGMRSRDGARLTQALAAADRALQIEPTLREALFNRALALEQRGDTAGATAAWTRVRSAEGDSGWSREAQEHLQRLSTR